MFEWGAHRLIVEVSSKTNREREQLIGEPQNFLTALLIFLNPVLFGEFRSWHSWRTLPTGAYNKWWFLLYGTELQVDEKFMGKIFRICQLVSWCNELKNKQYLQWIFLVCGKIAGSHQVRWRQLNVLEWNILIALILQNVRAVRWKTLARILELIFLELGAISTGLQQSKIIIMEQRPTERKNTVARKKHRALDSITKDGIFIQHQTAGRVMLTTAFLIIFHVATELVDVRHANWTYRSAFDWTDDNII